jgi:hypothetical protein
MKDKWINISYEDDELKPYIEPESDLSDQRRIDILSSMGYGREEIEESLRSRKYDDIMANYLLLGKRTTEVSFLTIIVFILFLLNININSLYRTSPVILVRAQACHCVVYALTQT